MTVQAKDLGARLPITANRGRSDPSEAIDFSLDDLYDLAWYLSFDEGEAEDLVLAVFQGRGRDVTRNGKQGGDLPELLVQIYLKRNQSLLGYVGRQAGGLRRRVWSRPRTSILAKARDTSKSSILDKLSPEERVCLILRERLVLPMVEIGRITGFGVERSRMALFSARERLRSSLRER